MLSKRVIVFLAGILLVGCAQNERSDTSGQQFFDDLAKCNNNDLCIQAALLAMSFNREADQPTEDGVKVRKAETNGKTVTVNFDVPASLVDEPTREDRTNGQHLIDAFGIGICGSESIDQFFSLGGEIRVVSFLPSGEKFSDGTIASCEAFTAALPPA